MQFGVTFFEFWIQYVGIQIQIKPKAKHQNPKVIGGISDKLIMRKVFLIVRKLFPAQNSLGFFFVQKSQHNVVHKFER